MLNIKLRVKNLVKKYGTANPFELANELNIQVLYLDLPDTIQGCLVRVLRKKFILLNQNLNYNQQKIVVCHELGHARLHTGYEYYLHSDMSYYVPSKREKEANEFAIHLLSYSSDTDFNADLISNIIKDRYPDPLEIHKILSRLI